MYGKKSDIHEVSVQWNKKNIPKTYPVISESTTSSKYEYGMCKL